MVLLSMRLWLLFGDCLVGLESAARTLSSCLCLLQIAPAIVPSLNGSAFHQLTKQSFLLKVAINLSLLVAVHRCTLPLPQASCPLGAQDPSLEDPPCQASSSKASSSKASLLQAFPVCPQAHQACSPRSSSGTAPLEACTACLTRQISSSSSTSLLGPGQAPPGSGQLGHQACPSSSSSKLGWAALGVYLAGNTSQLRLRRLRMPCVLSVPLRLCTSCALWAALGWLRTT